MFESLWRVELMKFPDLPTMALSNYAPAATRARMVTSIPMFIKIMYDRRCLDFTFKTESVDVVLSDSPRTMLLLAEWMYAMSLPVAVAVKKRDHEVVYKSQER